MAEFVASKLLATGGRGVAGRHLLYTVPDGKTTIVKSILLRTDNPSATVARIVLTIAPGFELAALVIPIPAASHVYVELWLVLPPGYRILLEPDGVFFVFYWVSGSELSGVNEVTTVPTGG